MKFETILNAYSKAVGNLDWRTQSHDDFTHVLRQCGAFRARLIKMHHEVEADYYDLLITAKFNDPHNSAVINGPLPPGNYKQAKGAIPWKEGDELPEDTIRR